MLNCKCKDGWSGKLCELSREEAMVLLLRVDKDVAAMKSSEVISNELIEKLSQYQKIIASEPSLATPEVVKNVYNLAKIQVGLIKSGKAAANPELLGVLDFALELIM